MTPSWKQVSKRLCAPLLVTLLTACGMLHHHGGEKVEVLQAKAEIQARSGSSVKGSVQFTQQGDHLSVLADISGLTPWQAHGFHVHDKGDCSAADGMSAGGHFNPTGKPHGPPDGDHHAGDMPSLQADGSGHAVARFQLVGVTLGEGANSLIGHSLIVHKDPDDYHTQPTGNSGARIGCGVIVKIEKP